MDSQPAIKSSNKELKLASIMKRSRNSTPMINYSPSQHSFRFGGLNSPTLNKSPTDEKFKIGATNESPSRPLNDLMKNKNSDLK